MWCSLSSKPLCTDRSSVVMSSAIYRANNTAMHLSTASFYPHLLSGSILPQSLWITTSLAQCKHFKFVGIVYFHFITCTRHVTDFKSDLDFVAFSQIRICQICKPVFYQIWIWFSFWCDSVLNCRPLALIVKIKRVQTLKYRSLS